MRNQQRRVRFSQNAVLWKPQPKNTEFQPVGFYLLALPELPNLSGNVSFYQRKLAQNERFYALEEYRDTSTPFHPVKFLCKFELSNLPGEEEFIEVCKEEYNSTKNNINKEV